MTVLRLDYKNLCFSYGDKEILRGANLSLSSESVVLLTGPSGCGKTTLLRVLAGLEKPNAGELPPRLRCSVVFQEDRLLPGLSALRNTQLVLPRRPKEAGNRERLRACLAEILPPESLDVPVEQLSGGMCRRAAIARAVLADSELLLMDEPLNGLDADTERQVIAFIQKYRNRRPMLIVTHRTEPFRPLCPVILRLAAGKLQ